MKTIITMLATILFTFTAFAADYTYSNHEPQIQRLQGVVLFPTDITVEEIDRDGITETQYKYRLVRVQDTGQVIHQDRAKWIDENKDLIDTELYGSMSEVLEKIATGKIDDLGIDAAKKLIELKKDVPKLVEKPVEIVKPLPTH